MYKQLVKCIFLLSLFLKAWLNAEQSVTFGKSGRFGDDLICYLHAKWISYKFNIPLKGNFSSFAYAQDLVLYDKEMHLQEADKTICFTSESMLEQYKDKSVCFMVEYFPESDLEGPKPFQVDWKNPVFRKLALEMISSKKPLTLTLPPKNAISIAIHVREGGNYDVNKPLCWGAKFPPSSYYADSLKDVAALFPNKMLHVQVFTDAVSPAQMVKGIKNLLPSDLKLTWHYRKSENNETLNVLEDFFSLFHYDILIRPNSNFSLVPELLHDYTVVIFPQAFFFTETVAGITERGIKIDPVLHKKLLNKRRHQIGNTIQKVFQNYQ